jgi:predicted kinase
MDSIRQRLLPQSDHRIDDRDIAYRAMHFAAELLVSYSGALILDATYARASCRTELSDVAIRLNGDLFVIECHVGADVAQERFHRRRVHPALDLTPDRINRLAASYPYFRAACAMSGTTQPDHLARAIRHLQTTPPLSVSEHSEWCRRGQPSDNARELLLAASSNSDQTPLLEC